MVSRASATRSFCAALALVAATARPAAPETVHVPPVEISALAHRYAVLGDQSFAGDEVTFPGSGYSSEGFTAQLDDGDTVRIRYQAPPGRRFLVHASPGSPGRFYVRSYWIAAGGFFARTSPFAYA